MTIIHRKPGVSLYFQIKEYMKSQIEKGIWKPGSQIPVEAELVEMFGVSRMTVRQAISELVKSGYLVSRQGSGTFVMKPKFEADIVKLVYPEAFGRYHKLISLTKVSCPPEVAEALNLNETQLVMQLYRVRYFNETPAALEKAFFKLNLLSQLDEKDIENTVHDLFEKNGINFVRADSTVEPVQLSTEESRLLEVENNSLGLVFTRVIYTYNNRPVLYSRNLFGGDKCKLVFNTFESSSV
jgi:GntR family transcriptional regulator